MDSSTPCARLCHIVKWEHFDGYGFNLHAEKGKSGQFIGKVDEGSPSEAAGLKQGDRIVEVNEINIANESHKQVVERIKAFPAETKLLVVDQPADDYFKAGNVPIKGTMPGVKYLKTPERNYAQDDEDEMLDGPGLKPSKTTSNGSQGTTSDTHSIASSGDGHSSSSHSNSLPNNSSMHNKEHNGNGSGTIVSTSNDNNEDNISNKSSSSSSKDVQPIAGPNGSLNLKMSAKELRAQLAARKKYDPKKLSMDFKDKFDIVQKL